MTLAERIAELVEQHGSLRAAARVLDCDPGYLSRIQRGEKVAPEGWLLRRMGLRRVVAYERTARFGADNEVQFQNQPSVNPGA